MIRPSRVLGWGGSLPDKTLTNLDLEARLDTSDQWIVERTGIRERRVDGDTAEMAIEAARNAMAVGSLDPGSIDLVIVATCTSDQVMPAVATRVQHALGLRCAGFDLNAACSGYLFAMLTAYGLLGTGFDRILVVGSDAMTRVIDPHDRGTAILFGDGAGALVLAADEGGPGGLLGHDSGTDGSLRHILYCDAGDTMKMAGPEVFKVAVRAVVESGEAAMANAGVTAADIDFFVPHQANIRIVDAACSRMGIPPERSIINLDRTGNTSAGSIPLVLSEAAQDGRLVDGSLLMVSGFGSGMTWGTAIVRWQS